MHRPVHTPAGPHIYLNQPVALRTVGHGARELQRTGRRSASIFCSQNEQSRRSLVQMLVRARCLTTAAVLLLCLQYGVVTSPKVLLSQERREVLSVNVELVNVTATVIDDSGGSVQDLTATDFQVFEDGQEQKISFFSHDSNVPVSIGVLLDISGSLQDKLRQALH